MLAWLRRVAYRVNRTDRELVRRSAAVPPSVADRGLSRLGSSADHSLLWFAAAAVLTAAGGSNRRAAVRGVLAIAGASLTANVLAKPVMPRRRPAFADVPARRRPDERDRPNSSSFPSGHAASAAAFTTAVAMESPAAGAVVAPVAAAVAYSRVHTGVHWPSDVVVGALLGTGIALATRRWWPVRIDEPAVSSHPTRVRATPDGDGLVILINPQSGHNGEDPGARLAADLPAARLFYPRMDADLVTQLETELHRDRRPVLALGVAGGDGTVASVAALAASRKLPLLVVPAGTLNHFARDIGVSTLEDAVDAVREGTTVTVDVGTVQIDHEPPRLFVNTASLGGYPDLVRFRERWEPRWGRWPAAAAALIRVMRESRPLPVFIGGVPRHLWLVFVGNGRYRPRGFAAATRRRMDTTLLDVRYVRADLRLSRSRFLTGALAHALERSRTYVQQDLAELDIDILGAPVGVATDGEVVGEGWRFRFCSYPAALQVYRPREDHTSWRASELA